MVDAPAPAPALARTRGAPGRFGAGAPGALATLAVLLVGVPAVAALDRTGPALAAQLVGTGICAWAVRWGWRAAAVTRGRWSVGWRLLGGSAAFWGLADLVTVVSVALPDRGINGGIYPLQGASMLAVLTALLVFPRPRWRRGLALRTYLDVGVVLSSLALVGVLLTMTSVTTVATGADLVFAVAYPVGALAFLGLAYELSRRHVHSHHPELALLTGGIALWVAGAAAYSYWTPTAIVAPAGVSWAIGVGVGLLGVAARTVSGPHLDGSADLGSRAAWVVLAVPNAAVLTAAVTVVITGLTTFPQRLLAAAIVVASLARHVVVTADSRRFHWSLEREVAERTTDLRRLSERYAGILDTVGDGIVRTDGTGRITFANAAALALLGQTREGLLGQDVCGSLCAERHLECRLSGVGTGAPVRGVDLELRRADGRVVPVEVHGAAEVGGPVPGPEHGRGAVIAFRDVSERHAVEQVKRQFVSSVSHELRTPLTSIRGVLELLVDGSAGALSPVGQSLAANASRGAERLSRLVDDIIDAERLVSGEFRLHRTRVPVRRLLHDTVTVLEPLAAASDARIDIGATVDVEIWGDADRAEQALVNLVGNALKFSPPGGVVTVEAEAHDGSVLVTVRDEGPGIPPDQLQHVFERFHQVTHEDATDRGGTGLGLTITRSIVELHGGRIWVDSTLGEGSTFRFTLPMVDSVTR